jgi:dephospho-CoA kinase
VEKQYTGGGRKTTAGKHLEHIHGYHHIEASSVLEAEACRRGATIPTDRPALGRVGDDLIREYGSGIIARRSLAEYDDASRHIHPSGPVVTGLRRASEVQAVLDYGGLVLYIDAPDRYRHSRTAQRGRPCDRSPAEMQIRDQAELLGETAKGESGIHILGIKELATTVVTNDKSVAEFYAVVDRALGVSCI